MIDLALIAVVFVGGFYIGEHRSRWVSKFQRWRRMRKMGICFNYQGKGYRETIDGTSSEFCTHCDHPYGYHQ